MIYLVWGSTYLAIRFAIESLPPLWMAGWRFLLAGALMFAWVRVRDPERPTLRHWGTEALIGALLFLGGNGGVTWSEQFISSGLAALLIATVPLWVALIEWVRPHGRRPAPAVFAGVAMGLAGLAILIGPEQLLGGERPHWGGALAVLIGSIFWSIGVIYSRHAHTPRSPILGAAMQMMCGGALLILASLATGEAARLDLTHVSARSWISFLYLVFFGSVLAFTCFAWLIRVVSSSKVTTYAFVNPVVAVLLGAAFAGEKLTARTMIAAAIIIGAVALLTLLPGKPAAKAS